MDNRPVCIFDSGFGGLTAVRALRKLLPDENIIFFADTGRVPYGGRPVQQLRTIAAQDIETVSEFNPKLIIAACGTVSSTAPDVLAASAVKTIGVLEPTAKATAELDFSGPVGIIATQASINSGAFEKRIRELSPGREIIPIACPDFVPMIESGRCNPDDRGVRQTVKKYLQPLKEAKAGALILGCTHYGLIGRAISEYLGEDTLLIEASSCAAREAKDYLTANNLLGSSGEEHFYTSGSTWEFTSVADVLLGRIIAKQAEFIPPKEL